MWVQYVGMHDEVEVDGLPDLVERGVPVDVPDELAGRAPVGHRADGDGFDPGDGLLAQPENWQPAENPAEASARAAAKEAAKAAAAAAKADRASGKSTSKES